MSVHLTIQAGPALAAEMVRVETAPPRRGSNRTPITVEQCAASLHTDCPTRESCCTWMGPLTASKEIPFPRQETTRQLPW